MSKPHYNKKTGKSELIIMEPGEIVFKPCPSINHNIFAQDIIKTDYLDGTVAVIDGTTVIDGASGKAYVWEGDCWKLVSVSNQGDIMDDEFLKELEDMLDDDQKAIKTKQNSCFHHDWRYYEGITEVYEYCTKCDKKRDKE